MLGFSNYFINYIDCETIFENIFLILGININRAEANSETDKLIALWWNY